MIGAVILIIIGACGGSAVTLATVAILMAAKDYMEADAVGGDNET